MSAARSSEIIQISPEERKAMVKALGSVAAHPNKPRTMFCRRRHLMHWTGWSDWLIDRYVETGLLKVRDCPGRRRLFDVRSVQEIIDSGK